MKRSTLLFIQFFLSAAIGTTIACSPTKFDVGNQNLCESSNDSCVVQNDVTQVTQNFKVGAGKVDILFIDDNSASMSRTQSKLAARFAGFIETLDRKEIDYQIGITKTDIAYSDANGLIPFSNGQKILKNTDSNRVSQFNGAIVRSETLSCENFIISAYNTYGPSFRSTEYYQRNYSIYCFSDDERGIYSAHNVISQNTASLIRPDANLNIIVISNEDVRSGLYSQNPNFALDEKDKASTLANLINSQYPGKYWEFNSIITKDASCAQQQSLEFVGPNGQPIIDQNGEYVIKSNIGLEYAALSASAATDVDGNASPRGQILSICNNDYASYFANIAAKISDSARLLTLKCTPMEAPVVTNSNGQQVAIPYSWNGGDKIVFQRGSEGIQIKVQYRCYTGVR